MYLTIKLFYKNTYIKEFNANIVHIVEKDDSFHVELNQTAFYPEGGGQPSDEGYIDDVKVSYVYEDNAKIYHVLDRLPSTLEEVKCTINWEKRFDHMQQHLGQHILSAAFEKLHDANTIGFHLSSNTVTIDIDKVLTSDDIKKVEYFTNQIVFNDLLVKILYPSKEDLETLPLRKAPSVSDNIRIVKIDDLDYSPCCGTHPNRSGEVGLIKIRKYEKYKSGLRIDFVCGNRALKDYNIKNDIVNSLSYLLSANVDEVLDIVDKNNEELKNIKKENKNLKDQLIKFEAIELLKNAEVQGNIKIVKNIFEHRNINEIKLLSANLVDNDKTIVIFAISSNNKAQLVFSRSKDLSTIVMKDILTKCLPLIDGKGGGSPFAAQGGGTKVDNLGAAIDLAHNEIKKICLH